MPPSTFPARPEHVSSEWLSEVLGQHVASFATERIGTGQVGLNIRFSLDGDGPLRSVVGKFTSDDPTSRATGVTLRNYEREVRFYREIVDTVGIRTPACYVAEWDPESGDIVILLEDLAPAEPGDQIAGTSPSKAAIALDELARLHAPRWDDPHLDDIDWLSRTTPESAEMVQMLYQAMWPGFVERYADRLPRSVLDLGERFGSRVGAWAAAPGPPYTVTHGDYRLDNMLFGTGEGGYPLAVVDWQTPGHGPGAGDCAYFIGAGLTVDDRRLHEHDLVHHWHRALEVHGVEDYPFDQAWEDYRALSFGGLLMAVVASMIVGQDERGDRMFLAMAERHGIACLDLDAEALLPA